ncbi:DUF443 family protein [Salipaludibacillus agaradhaerens]|jgi:uncharacterized membrane protein (TIGR01218 family)|uniref:DUF443 domain-containing protein n=1 Tax=Salipaludibacillus agaradhaerens TaxID=76935 RepID=UPI0021510AFC|nr:DUF443 domain-containing protein [Salipaludibacillus agaradhaerens]MCR6105709.1 DUF443 family protein [Salipaludibacillus agaradhaerens]MCR6117745.1 DUF443 family protein [Salipaludibacillus agaradhaerens]
MTSEIKKVEKNIRYRMVEIGGESYLLDVTGSFWKVLFPFAFWLFPTHLFKVRDTAILEDIIVLRNEKNSNILFLSIIGMALLGARFLDNVRDYFNMNTTFNMNIVILSLLITATLFCWFYMSKKNKEKLFNKVTVDEAATEKVWIRPLAKKFFVIYTFSYLWLFSLMIVVFWIFVNYSNFIHLISSLMTIFVLLIFGTMAAAPGKTYVKLVNTK